MKPADDEDYEEIEEVVEFEFQIPAGAGPGTTLKVTAPDNIELHIPLPSKARPGDRMTMEKSEAGKWGIKCIIREQVGGVVSQPQAMSAATIAADLADTTTCLVTLDTTRGPIKLRLVPAWAPKGCQRFLQLVTDKYYTDILIYRAVPGFLVQFGVVHEGDPRHKKYQAIEDDPLRGIPIQEGMICFAASGPATRTATICIFLDSFDQLGKQPWETPIGKVDVESMPVLRSIFTGYGDMPQCEGTGPDPIELQAKGPAYILEQFPRLDIVKSASWSS